MSTAQALHDARALLERVGWTQHSESDTQGVRLVGALLAVCKAATGFPYEGLAEPLGVLRQGARILGGRGLKGEPSGQITSLSNGMMSWCSSRS
jgi:hypothetical protein